MNLKVCIGSFLLCASWVFGAPQGFVSLKDVDATITVELRYFGSHNFIGRPIKGYTAPKCILTQKAAEGLANVQKELIPYGLSLKVYDCYRPQKAVDDFVAWGKKLSDTKMRREFYPKVEKKNVFKDGFIAEKSGHSRGSTVDLTLIPWPASEQKTYQPGQALTACNLPIGQRFADNSLDMGTGYDCFDPLSHTANAEVGDTARKNRLLLKSLMEKYGFKNYDLEWWHFTLKDEPYPQTYFDFDIE